MTWQSLLLERCRQAQKRSRQRLCGEEPLDKLIKESGALLEKQNYLCSLCGVRLTYEKRHSNTASLDRIFSSVKLSPQKESKCGYLHNMRWVCTTCNHLTRSCHMKNAKYTVDCK
jgi:hypothetical protein